MARQIDPSAYTDKQYEELYELLLRPKGNPLAVDPNGGMYPEIYVGNMKSMVHDKSLDAVMPLEKIWDSRFVEPVLWAITVGSTCTTERRCDIARPAQALIRPQGCWLAFTVA